MNTLKDKPLNFFHFIKWNLLPSIVLAILMGTVTPEIMEPFRVKCNGFLIYFIFALLFVLSKFIDKKNFILLADVVFITTLGFNIDHDFWVNNKVIVGLIIFGVNLILGIVMFTVQNRQEEKQKVEQRLTLEKIKLEKDQLQEEINKYKDTFDLQKELIEPNKKLIEEITKNK